MRFRVFSLLVLLATATTACGGGGGGATTSSFAQALPTPAVTFAGNPPLVPAQDIYLGAFANTGTSASDEDDLATLESQIGRKFALSMHYYSWTGTFPNQDEVTDAQNGRIPVISWNCGIPNSEVAAGAGDANIVAHAQALRAYGHPVFLRYQWEFDLPAPANNRAACYDPTTDEAGGVFSPTQFVAAWNHIHAIFVAQGATNVAFLWNPSGSSQRASDYYPGGSTVDWVGIDEYDRSNIPFANVFSLYAQVAPLDKPIMIAETEATQTYQPTFFSGAVAALQTVFPAVKAFMIFDAPGNPGFNWTLSPAGIAAFASIAKNPYLSAMP
jgi:hypothetical protein